MDTVCKVNFKIQAMQYLSVKNTDTITFFKMYLTSMGDYSFLGEEYIVTVVVLVHNVL